VAAFLSIQALIGGTRLLSAFSAYGLLAVAGALAPFLLRTAKPAPDQICYGARCFSSGMSYCVRFSRRCLISRGSTSTPCWLLCRLFSDELFIDVGKSAHVDSGLLLIAAMAHVLVRAIQFRNGDNFMPIPFFAAP